MAIQYIIQERDSNFAIGRKRRYYLIAKSTGRVGRKDLIRYMVVNASLTPSEASSALDYLFEAIPHFLKMGKTIDLGDLGNIKATIRSEGSDSEKEVTVHKVREICLHFTPSAELKREMQEVALERLEVNKEQKSALPIRRATKQKPEQQIALEEKQEIARKALGKGLSPAMISELTGLDEEEIGRL